MLFLSPIWLIGLLPWAVVTTWLLLGRRPKQPVPFLPLWQGPVALPTTRRGLRMPPLGLAFMMAAMLAGMLAAARPSLPWIGPARFSKPVTIIVDCGQTMSMAPGVDRQPRYLALAREVAGPLRDALGDGTVELVELPLGQVEISTRSSWADVVAKLPPTAADTRSEVVEVVARLLRQNDGLVIVLSDQAVDDADARVLRIAPPPVEHVGITHVAAAAHPRPQIMVTLRNHGSRSRGTLKVTTGAGEVNQDVQLPPNGQQKNYFVDVPLLGSTIAVKLQAGTYAAADQQAWLVRTAVRPAIEVRLPILPALQHMIEVYGKCNSLPQNQSQASVPVIAVTSSAGKLEPTETGVVLAAPDRDVAAAIMPSAGAVVVAHPLSAAVDWEKISKDVVIYGQPPEGVGWMPLVSLAGRTMIAVRENPARQVWVGFDSPTWAATVDYVVFWANAFDWLSGGAEQDQAVARGIGPLASPWKAVELADGMAGQNAAAPGWWPGIYELHDGSARCAVNANYVPVDAAGPSSWQAKLAAATVRFGRGVELTSPLLLLAVLCVCGAALSWEKQRRSVVLPASSGRV